jgi:tRNA pseudouridine38-40 synthase
MRFFLELSYKGTNYHGWQVQSNANTVQAEINKALSTILNAKIEVMGAGRTDAGVHAKQMYAHFDYNTSLDAPKLIMKLNSFLKNDIAIHAIFPVDADTHCRFDAISRVYKYNIVKCKSPFADDAYFVHKKLDVAAMNMACDYFLGKQDFTSFSKANTQTFTNDCTIFFAQWKQENDILVFTIKADRFLRNMVRAIVGTMLEVGVGKISAADVKDIIAQKDRCLAGTSVPANALFLSKIEYPKNIIE